MKYRTVVLLTYATATVVGGCDRDSGAPGANSSAATATAAATPTPAERYGDAVRPLVEELTRMRLLVERPETVDAVEFRRQLREVKLRFAQVEPAVTAEDRTRPSWQQVEKAMHFLGKADEGLAREEALGAEAQRAAPASETTDARLTRMRRSVEMVKELSAVSADVPRAMAAAGGAILLVESYLKDGK